MKKKTLLLVILCAFCQLNGKTITMNTTPCGFVEETNDVPHGYERTTSISTLTRISKPFPFTFIMTRECCFTIIWSIQLFSRR